MSMAFVTYVFLIIVPFLRRRPDQKGDALDWDWHLLIPCRDEEEVIGDTIRYLRQTFPAAHLWVIDDDSADDTVRVVDERRNAGAEPDENVHLVRRYRPDARLGKGEALNAGYRAIKAWLGDDADPGRVIVVVVDADGRPAPNCLSVCAAPHLFGDPAIGAVQIDVRMSNRGQAQRNVKGFRRSRGSLLVRMQDLEFRSAIAAIQYSRKFTGTISMGGNGQFTRLSALDSIAGDDLQPWGGCLLEDFELGVHLLTAGWRTGFSNDTHVDQEGLYSVRRFLAQRTRWSQGTMQCSRYTRRIWSSEHLSTVGTAEMIYYLAQPWMQLVGSIVYPIPMIILAARTVQAPDVTWAWFGEGAWMFFAVYGTIGLLPFLVWGPIYWLRCEREGSVLRGIGWGLTYAVYIYSFYITSWRALIRLGRKRNGWAKTRRNVHEAHTETAAVEH
ncbi:glycosyltransferase family 2 protein [Qaidamihabitans albus]|uniref:glycosyltransferase family 2 protein n=1 Tax=Qaidamihabitans albus TaxID=2795733 RepID=UPI0018F139D9|nr:glycosyltransferase [Qaidamihabitans albus]